MSSTCARSRRSRRCGLPGAPLDRRPGLCYKYYYSLAVLRSLPCRRSNGAVNGGVVHSTDRTPVHTDDRATDTARLERTIAGVVEMGDQRGRTIGFPTANIRLGLRHV